MKPSTSLGTRSNVGMVNPSPLVRQAGNIRGLLRIYEVYRRNILSSCSHVKDRCRCRVKEVVPDPEGEIAGGRPLVGIEKRHIAGHSEAQCATGLGLLGPAWS